MRPPTDGVNGIGPTTMSAKAWYAVGLLIFANVLNFMDRTVLAVLLPAIKVDLDLSDGQLGWLSGMAFALFYATFGLPLARLADVWIRKHILTVSLIAWSGMTMASGAAGGFGTLLIARMGVGVGEAGCMPASHSLISDIVPRERRASAFGLHSAGATVGLMVGLMLGGWLVGKIGWRWTFVAMGAPGLAFAALCALTFREPVRGAFDPDAGAVQARMSGITVFKRLAALPIYRNVVMAFGTTAFISYGVVQWMPSHYIRTFGISTAQAGLMLGLIMGAGSTVGSVIGGFAVDRLMKRDGRWLAWFPAIVLATTAPLLAITVWSHVLWLAIAANVFFSVAGGMALGPIYLMIQFIARPQERSVSVAIVMLAASILGMGGGPLLIGYLSDFFAAAGSTESLRQALLWSSLVPVWTTAHLFKVSRLLPGYRQGEGKTDTVH